VILTLHFFTQRQDLKLIEEPKTSKRGSQFPAAAGATRSRVSVWGRRLATIAVGTLALGMAYGVVFGHNGLTSFAHKREEAKSLQAQMQQLKTENERLHGHVDRLQNDPAAIEHEAREELHYTRAGEVIYTLSAKKTATDSNAVKH
jgi:cell division protein FtsB